VVTGYPPYPAYPAGAPRLAEPDPVQVAVAEPAVQRRATVAFRVILVIPHMFLLFFLAIAAFVVAFLGWWGALFTGRLPEFAVNYLTGFMRWVLRYQAYLYLLTDAYPPCTLDEVPGYPVRLAIPERQQLNRAAVFFRVILAIPGAIVSAVVTEGASSIVLFVAWLIAFVTGHLPRPLHQALTALLRYQARFYSYYLMLTPAYPWGLLGDAPLTPPAYPPGNGAMPDYGTAPGYYAPGYGTRASVYGAAAGYGPGQTVFQPASWQLILSQSARRLVILFVVLGVLTYALNGIRSAATVSNAIHRAQGINTTNNAINAVNSSYGTLTTEMKQWQDTVSACDQNLTCVTKSDGNAATYFTDFATELHATPMPSSAAAAANRVYSGALRVGQEYAQLSQAPSVATYQSTFERLGLQQSLSRFDQAFNALGAALTSS
jgi:Domain of unknown function (DUF4389)